MGEIFLIYYDVRELVESESDDVNVILNVRWVMKCIQAVVTVPMSFQPRIPNHKLKNLLDIAFLVIIWTKMLDHHITTNSLHYFHSYAVKNRIDISNYSDDHPKSLDISPDKILPTQADLKDLLGNFETLIEKYNHVYWTCMLIHIISKVYCYI